jgi:hypothetical protein
VPYAVEIGPFHIAEAGLLKLYIAIEDDESIASAQAAHDADALADLVGQMPDAASASPNSPRRPPGWASSRLRVRPTSWRRAPAEPRTGRGCASRARSGERLADRGEHEALAVVWTFRATGPAPGRRVVGGGVAAPPLTRT